MNQQINTLKTLLFSLLFLTQHFLFSQSFWQTNATVGADFTSLLQFNPKVGAGDNQLGFGASIALQANYSASRTKWENSFSFNYGVQRVGFGNSPGTNVKTPYQKSVDQIRLSTKWGYRVSPFFPTAKLLYTIDLSFMSQVSKTYNGNFLTQPDASLVKGNNNIISQFLSPGTGTISIGLEYEFTDQFSAFLGPLSGKMILVLNDDIADSVIVDDSGNYTTLHGNPIKIDAEGFPIAYNNIDRQFGATFKLKYNDAFLEKRFQVKSNLTLFSNYLRDPEKIDVDWVNEFSLRIWGGFQVSLWTNLFYDYDIPVQKTDNFRIVEGQLTKGISYSQQFLIKYSKNF